MEDWWNGTGKSGNLVVVYGRRRIGKTRLCLEFVKNKPGVYFLAEQMPSDHQLKAISLQIGEYFGDDILASRGADSWEQLFKYIADKKTPFVLVVDEFPYLIEAEKGIASIFQKGWDLYLQNSSVFLILSGSSISIMQEHTLNYRAPLYGRRTGQIELQSLSFSAIEEAFQKRKFEELVEIFSVAGGVPAYLKLFDNTDALLAVIERSAFQREHFVSREVEFLLRQELREPRTYFAILSAIANKCTRLAEIINQTGLDKPTVSRYIGILSDLGFVNREVPVTVRYPSRSKQGNYIISDAFTDFWFQVVFHHQDKLERDDLKGLIKVYRDGLTQRLAYTYERICREIIWKWESEFFPFERVGRWWSGDYEIDVMALGKSGNDILFGEVKWGEKPIDVDVLERLKKSASAVVWGKRNVKKRYILFSKSGFTEKLKRVAKEEGVVLVAKNILLC